MTKPPVSPKGIFRIHAVRFHHLLECWYIVGKSNTQYTAADRVSKSETFSLFYLLISVTIKYGIWVGLCHCLNIIWGVGSDYRPLYQGCHSQSSRAHILHVSSLFLVQRNWIKWWFIHSPQQNFAILRRLLDHLNQLFSTNLRPTAHQPLKPGVGHRCCIQSWITMLSTHLTHRDING